MYNPAHFLPLCFKMLFLNKYPESNDEMFLPHWNEQKFTRCVEAATERSKIASRTTKGMNQRAEQASKT